MIADMNLQDGALAALAAMSTFSVTLLKILWDRSNVCEKDRIEMHKTVELLKNQIGVLRGTLNIVERCTITGCPFRTLTSPAPFPTGLTPPIQNQ